MIKTSTLRAAHNLYAFNSFSSDNGPHQQGHDNAGRRRVSLHENVAGKDHAAVDMLHQDSDQMQGLHNNPRGGGDKNPPGAQPRLKTANPLCIVEFNSVKTSLTQHEG
ncbi:unnamed protein product, partial [Iphiclides podalirius]